MGHLNTLKVSSIELSQAYPGKIEKLAKNYLKAEKFSTPFSIFFSFDEFFEKFLFASIFLAKIKTTYKKFVLFDFRLHVEVHWIKKNRLEDLNKHHGDKRIEFKTQNLKSPALFLARKSLRRTKMEPSVVLTLGDILEFFR